MCQSSNQSPLISVIVPVYNGETTIAECIQSLLNQDISKEIYEIIIVDNNSTDKTKEIVKKYPVILREELIHTSYAARNRGIMASKGKFVAFTDADCIADKNWLKELLTGFEYPNIGAVSGTIHSIMGDTLIERFVDAINPYRKFSSLPVSMYTGNACYRKELVVYLGMFDEAMYTGGDVDLGWRLQIHTDYQLNTNDKAIVYHKHNITLRGLFKQYHRYGFGEMLLRTLYKESDFFSASLKDHLRMLGSHTKSLIIYLASILYRRVRVIMGFKKTDDIDLYLSFPRLHFVIEFATLLGKVNGLMKTKGTRKFPYRSRIEIVR
jgi:glycosyltransferase involved in cell wall biosynthesis